MDNLSIPYAEILGAIQKNTAAVWHSGVW